MDLGNVLIYPGQSARVEIDLVQKLEAAEGAFQFTLPQYYYPK